MSRGVERRGVEDLPPPICEFCGGAIERDEQSCPALDEGRCRA